MLPARNVNAGIRLASMIMDHFFMCMVLTIFFIPVIFKSILQDFSVSHEPAGGEAFAGPLFFVAMIGFALYFCKDCIQGRSIAKRILKLQVVDDKTGEPASPVKCVIRNMLCVIWPVEVIVTLVNPGKRLGDRLAGTRVDFYNPGLVDQPKLKAGRVLIAFALAFGFTFLVALPFTRLWTSSSKIKYIESSYNPSQSKALEKLYSDSLGQYLTASVRVYDKIEGNNLKYISVIFHLKENYLEQDGDRIGTMAKKHLYSMFAEDSVTGRAQYIYRENHFMQTSAEPLGVKIVRPK